MEYVYMGYGAARNPLPEQQQHPRPPVTLPARSNSTKPAPTSRRTLFSGHRRSNSADSAQSRSSHERLPPLPASPDQPPSQPPGQPSGQPLPPLLLSLSQPLSPRRLLPRHGNQRLPVPVPPPQPPPPPPSHRLEELDLDPDIVSHHHPHPGRSTVPSPLSLPVVSVSVSAGSSSSSAVSVPSLSPPSLRHRPPASAGSAAATAADRRQFLFQLHHSGANLVMLPDPAHFGKLSTGAAAPGPPVASGGSASHGRPESLSSASGSRIMASSEALSRMDSGAAESSAAATGTGTAARASQQSLASSGTRRHPFVVRNGRTYLADPTLAYPLPVDLPELHRQSLRTLLLIQLFGGPVCSPSLAKKPPTRVLEVGCGPGFWSTMCNQYYVRQGHRGISFTGMDVAPIGQRNRIAHHNSGGDSGGDISSSTGGGSNSNSQSPADGKDANAGMNWTFVQHDMCRRPWPFPDGHFDLIMIKDMSLALVAKAYQDVVDESVRLLDSGGTLEVWDSDHKIRMLRPHVPEASALSAEEEEDHEAAIRAGAYIMTAHTPLSTPLNNYIVEYNSWLAKAFDDGAHPMTVPCTTVGAMFLQEADRLLGAGSRRLAVPLSEVKWEREGVGGVVTKDGKPYIETNKSHLNKGKTRDAGDAAAAADGRRSSSISPAQSALRRTALLTVVQMIQSLEPVLRESSCKSQDEWDGWYGKMTNDLMKENGTSWGECLEVGAWWAVKK